MKKSLLALAVLGAFAGAASAQSTVTLYGRVDLSLGKPIGTEDQGIFNGSGSRLGVRGVEDLGGGLKALFNIEHRYQADTGVASPTVGAPLAGSSTSRFWHGRSIVGLEGGFGRVWLGREYTPVFLTSTLLSDPWGNDTVASMDYMIGTGAVRNDSTINYQIAMRGFTAWVQVAEGTDAISNTPDRKVGFALSYGAGPLYAAYGYDDQGGNDDKWHHFTVNYNFGAFKLLTGFGTGDTNATATVASQSVKTMFVGATMPIGAGELRVGYGEREIGDVTTIKKAGLGYHYALSKRTTMYFDVAHDSEATTPIGNVEKTGYDVGIKHNF